MLSDTPEKTFNYNYSLIPVAFLALSLSPDDFNDKKQIHERNDYTLKYKKKLWIILTQFYPDMHGCKNTNDISEVDIIMWTLKSKWKQKEKN